MSRGSKEMVLRLLELFGTSNVTSALDSVMTFKRCKLSNVCVLFMNMAQRGILRAYVRKISGLGIAIGLANIGEYRLLNLMADFYCIAKPSEWKQTRKRLRLTDLHKVFYYDYAGNIVDGINDVKFAYFKIHKRDTIVAFESLKRKRRSLRD